MKSILVATDGSHSADRAVRAAAQLAKATGACLSILNVCSDATITDDARNLAFELDAAGPLAPVSSDLAGIYATLGWREALTQFDVQAAGLRHAISEMVLRHAQAVATDEGLLSMETHSRYGDPAREILAFSRVVGADLIVTGRRGLGQFAELLQGSVSLKTSTRRPPT